jgi:hypothetical protein
MELLLFCAGCDPSMLPAAEADRVAAARIWAQVLADVDLADALAAARRHYRATAERLAPAHIAAACDDRHRTGAAAEIASLPRTPPPDGYRSVRRNPAPAARCDWCGAAPHEPCTQHTRGGRTPRRLPHPARLAATV